MWNAGTLNTGIPESLPDLYLKLLCLIDLFDDAGRMCK